MFNLGKNLNMRYHRLLPKNGRYTKDNMFVVSSAAERCIMSAASFMAAFFPPLENQNGLSIPWQPVPINTIPRDRDHILAQKKLCPRYDEALRKLLNASTTTDEIKAINDKNAELYEHLSKHSGNVGTIMLETELLTQVACSVSFQNVTNILDIELLYNTLEIEQNAGLALPAWTANVFPDK